MTAPSASRTGQGVGLTTVSLALVLAALPTFLVGGLAVQIRDELGFSEAALGAAVTVSFLAGALAAPLVGPLTDRLGPRAAICIGGCLSMAGLVGIATLASSWAPLTGFLLVAGVAFAFIDPGLAVLVTRTIPPRRHGMAFGIKEASIPLATLAAGLAVPAIALTVGWRWAFLLGAVPIIGLGMLLPRIGPGRTRAGDQTDAQPGPGPKRSALLLIATAAALGSAAASGVGVFLTESAVAMGVGPSTAGLLLATGSVAGIVTRIGTGFRADRVGGDQLGLMGWMLMAGAGAMALGALGTTAMLAVGAAGAFAGGWGWTGLLFLSLVRVSPNTPGAAAAVGMSGLGVGNALGPLGFGLTAQGLSFPAAWLAASAAAALAAGVVWLARKRL